MYIYTFIHLFIVYLLIYFFIYSFIYTFVYLFLFIPVLIDILSHHLGTDVLNILSSCISQHLHLPCAAAGGSIAGTWCAPFEGSLATIPWWSPATSTRGCDWADWADGGSLVGEINAIWLIYAQHMANTWLIYAQHMANTWLIYAQHMANTWLIYAQYMANTWLIYG